VQQLQDGEAAEHALNDYASERDKAESAKPGALLFFPKQSGKNGDKYAQDEGNHAVGMLIQCAAGEQTERRKPGTEGGGPVRHGQRGVFRCD
jgi:hypothetical protein